MPLERLSAALLGLSLLAPAAPAQAPLAGSESQVVIAPVTPAGTGYAASEQYQGHLVAGLLPSGAPASSPSYVLEVAVVGTEAALSPSSPLVFGTSPDAGGKHGGEPVAVLGFDLDDTTGAVNVLFGSSPATVGSLSNTAVQVTTPPGANAFGNPLGSVDVAVTNGLGTGTGVGVFAYTPALLQASPARVGQDLVLHLRIPAGSVHQVVFGQSAPGIAVPIPPLGGALELIQDLVTLVPLQLSATGDESYPLPIPANPALVGVQAEFQAVAIANLLTVEGSFTNRLVVPIEP